MQLVGQAFVKTMSLNSLMSRGVHNNSMPIGGIPKEINKPPVSCEGLVFARLMTMYTVCSSWICYCSRVLEHTLFIVALSRNLLKFSFKWKSCAVL